MRTTSKASLLPAPSLPPAGALGLLALALSSCTGGGGGGGNFQIVSCSLGCSGSGAGGDGQVTCGIQDVFVNGELRIQFGAPVSAASLSVFSVQVTQLGTGKTPPADRFVDPNDPAVLVYRPKLTFDSAGSPVFGLSAGSSYTIKLPGVVEDPGSEFVRSTSGTANKHRMLCTVEASLGILDTKPGAPGVEVTVDQVTSYDPITGEPATFAEDVPADGAVDVYRFSDITMVFDDLMNPATLVNPVTGASQSIQVMIDPDGIVSDPSDQQPLLGTYSIQLDQNELTTTVIFEPELGYPSAGTDPDNKRKIVVVLPPSITDLGGNPLADPGSVAFTPEVVIFEPATIEETFLSGLKKDVAASGGNWGDQFPGLLLPGVAGGSGRLGHLFLDAGQSLVLDTDGEDFSSITDALIFSPANVIDATFDGDQFVVPPVTDGVFDFASLTLSSGSQLRFEGSQPARVFVRGEAINGGRFDVSGRDRTEHDDKQVLGQAGGDAGASGGRGGDGGRLPTWVNFELIPGVTVPGVPTTPPTLAELNGQDGEGVPDNLLNPTGTDFGNGTGGLAWPQATASTPTFHFPVDPLDILGVQWDQVFFCEAKMKGAVGGGGAFGLNGTGGENKPIPGTQPTPPPTATGGLASDFGLGIGSDPESPQRRLSPEEGYLHGGAGGSGGGSHLHTTRTNGILFGDCTKTPAGPAAEITQYVQRSSAGGGGGGGAVQLQAGARLAVDGVVDGSGGQGGGKTVTNSSTAGGGGAGGALLLQSPQISIASIPGRIDVSGGAAGFGVGGSTGGLGGAGLLRIETFPPLPALSGEAPKLLPLGTSLTGGATIDDIFAIAEFEPLSVGPGALSGVQSCWIRPEGNFFQLEFLEDVGDELGWDLKLLPNPTALGEQSFRGENDLFAQSLETLLGNELGSSPLVVRFQGARAVKQIDDPCQVDLGGPDSPIFQGSLTGWVEHPAELNDFFGDASLRPNMIRFQIIFDRSIPIFGALTGITELTVQVLPD